MLGQMPLWQPRGGSRCPDAEADGALDSQTRGVRGRWGGVLPGAGWAGGQQSSDRQDGAEVRRGRHASLAPKAEARAGGLALLSLESWTGTSMESASQLATSHSPPAPVTCPAPRTRPRLDPEWLGRAGAHLSPRSPHFLLLSALGLDPDPVPFLRNPVEREGT